MRRNKPFPFHIIVFLAPAVIVYTMFMIYPLIDSLRISLYSADDESGQEVFVGLDNYQKLTTDKLWEPRLRGAIENNVKFFLVHMLVQNPLGLMLASLLASPFIRGRTIYRTLIFTPAVLSVVLIGFIWQMILSPLWGISGDFFTQIGLEQYAKKPWLGLEETALPVLSLISVWQWVGIPMMLFLAALISIPDELIEAARVDGATAWGVFWRIKFRLILPTVGIVSVLTFVGNFNAFDLIYATQKVNAGPNYSTDILGTFFYRTFYGQQLTPGNQPMGATIAGIMLLIILAGVLLYMFGWQRRVTQVEF